MTWNELATNPRWRGTVGFIRNWVGSFDASHGMEPDELDRILRAKALCLPTAVREWCLLTANWSQEGFDVWVPPEAFAEHELLNVWVRPEGVEEVDGMVEVLTDTGGINHWGVSVAGVPHDDPPVVDLETGEIDFDSFSRMVAAMVVNDVLFVGEEPAELNREATRAQLTCLVSSLRGEYFGDAPLESAILVAFVYPRGGPAFGKARTSEGRALLERLRLGRE